MKDLAGLKNLATLQIGSNNVTDAGIKQLRGVKNLKYLNVEHTKVTDAGLGQLKKALPTLQIQQ